MYPNLTVSIIIQRGLSILILYLLESDELRNVKITPRVPERRIACKPSPRHMDTDIGPVGDWGFLSFFTTLQFFCISSAVLILLVFCLSFQ